MHTINELNDIAQRLEASQDCQIFRRYVKPLRYCDDVKEEKLIGVFVDVETTGLAPGKDKIIELALVSFDFLPDGRIFSLLDEYNEFNDPGIPIPEEIVELTGITDAMVKGKAIDAEAVNKIIENATVIIAHNANFDRAFLENKFPIFEKKAWACSMRDIPWSEEGVGSVKLEYIAFKLGFFYDGHRAKNDCLAGIHVLANQLPLSKDSALKVLLDNARMKEYRIWAEGSSYAAKDILKARGYHWNSGDNNKPRSWFIDVSSERMKEEVGFLHSEIYTSEVELKVDYITAFNRYSSRA